MSRENLMNYRSDPGKRTLRRLHEENLTWVMSWARRVAAKYVSLGESDVDDLALEGILTMARAARRYVYMCPECPASFVSGARYAAHVREVHKVRGISVDVLRFARASSILAMRRTALKIHSGRKEVLSRTDATPEDEADPRQSEVAEAKVVVGQALRRMRSRSREIALAYMRGSISDVPDWAAREMRKLIGS